MSARDGIREALDLVTPCFCAGCGRLGEVLCARCEAPLYEPPSLVELAATDLYVWAAASYEGPIRRAILAWKRGRVDIAAPLLAAYEELADRWRVFDREEIGVVIPAPSGWKRRLTGRFVVGDAARMVALRLGVPHTDALRKSGGGHSGGASARARSQHAGSFRARRTALPSRALLVDDVVTTGVTLDASTRALAERGVTVVGAIVLAATPRRSEM